MSSADQPTREHQVGITNAQENNPDRTIADLTADMNARFEVRDYAEAARIALAITARSKDELRDTFIRHRTAVLYLDHEAFGIYGIIEPSYDLRVDGATEDVLAAAIEFGKRHAQEAVLVARRLREDEVDPAERLGLILILNRTFSVEEALAIVEVVRDCGFKGATFAPKRHGEVSIFHTDDLEMTTGQFEKAADTLVARLKAEYPRLVHRMQPYFLFMPKL